MNSTTLQTDAYSANTALDASHWGDFHTYRCEWKSGVDGYIRWSLDGEVQYQLQASMLQQTRTVSVDGSWLGTRRPLQMPKEPMVARSAIRTVQSPRAVTHT